MKTLVLGLGNPILRDDAVGLRVVETLRVMDTLAGHLLDADVTLGTTCEAGVHLLECMAGYEQVILVDAVSTGGTEGEIRCLDLGDLPAAAGPFCPHSNLDIRRILELGRTLGQPMPQRIRLVTIEAGDVTSFGEGLSPAVEKAIPAAVETVLAQIDEPEGESPPEDEIPEKEP